MSELFGIDVSKGIIQDEYEPEPEKTSYKKRINKKDLSAVNQITQSVDKDIEINQSFASKTKEKVARDVDFTFDEHVSTQKDELQ